MGTRVVRKAAGAGATPKFRASATTKVAVAANTWAVTRPTGASTAFLLAIAWVESAGPHPPTSPGWEQVGPMLNNGTNAVAVFARPANGNSDPATFTFTFSGADTASGLAVMCDYSGTAVTGYVAAASALTAAQQAPSIEAPTGVIVEVAFCLFSAAFTGTSVTTNVNSPTTEVATTSQGVQAVTIVDYPFAGVAATTGDTFTSTGTVPQTAVFTVAVV